MHEQLHAAFINWLLESIPEIGPLYQQHIDEQDELLAYIFLAEVARHLSASIDDKDKKGNELVCKTVNFIERELAESKSEHVKTLIALSFVDAVFKERILESFILKMNVPAISRELEILRRGLR